MKYLTRTADQIKILDDLIIKMKTNLLWKLGGEESPVDLFDKITWGVKDYTPLQRIVHTTITTHPTQTQQVENHVQLEALVCKTSVGEARATAHMMMHSYLIRR